MTRKLGLAALAILGSLSLAACGSTNPGAQNTGDPRIRVLSSTSVYADLAAKIGGDLVDSVPLIKSPSQDPHSYEATARDKLEASKSQLIIANGGGYDPFLDSLVTDLALTGDTVLRAVEHSPVPAAHEESEPETDDHDHDHDHDHAAPAEEKSAGDSHAGHDHAEYNEHLWYDVDSMQQLVPEIAIRLAKISPEHAETFQANATELGQQLTSLASDTKALRHRAAGLNFAMTEPVPEHLLEDAGFTDATPAGFSEAIEGDSEVSPQVFKRMGDLLASGKIQLLAYNTQTASPQTERIRDAALKANVHVVDFSETLPENTGYVQWMENNISAIDTALNELSH